MVRPVSQTAGCGPGWMRDGSVVGLVTPDGAQGALPRPSKAGA